MSATTTAALDRPLTVTAFRDHAVREKTSRELSLRELAERVRERTAATKAALPWLKLAAFGDTATPAGSLRHNANVQHIDGIEADYDGGEISPEDAQFSLEVANLAGVIYTSPSHSDAKPRWRVLCPLSATLPRDRRAGLVARLNGVLGGILARESFTLSQAYYFGSVGENPAHRVLLADGRYVDQADDLDAVAVWPARAAVLPVVRVAADAPPDEHAAAALTAALALFDDPAGDRHQRILSATAAVAPYVLSGHVDEADAVARISGAVIDSGREPNPGEIESAMSGALSVCRPYDPPTGGSEFPTLGPLPITDAAQHEPPVIQVVQGNITDVADQAERALVSSGRGVYHRGDVLVCLGETGIRTFGDREVQGVRIFELGEHALVEHLTASAYWRKWDARTKSLLSIDAPLNIAKTIMQRRGRWKHVPPLRGIVNAPTLRPDGTILDRPGYDAATGLLFDPRGVVFPPIPEAPTREDAEQAITLLRELISTFPFVTAAAHAVAISAIVTACVRRSLKAAPMHAVTAPTAGTGKSKLIDVASIIAVGREAGVISVGGSDEELAKRLSSMLLAGDSVFALDNIEAPLGGEMLCQILTQETVKTRVLGKSEAPELKADAFVCATGNNLQIVGDLCRRTLICHLDAEVERPELRVFERDACEVAKAGRGQYVSAVLTILRAHRAAGQPTSGLAPLGSFEEWCRTVRNALVWLGEADPAETVDAIRGADPELESLRALFSQWQEAIGLDWRITTAELLERVADHRHAGLRGVLIQVASDRGGINNIRLGKWLGKRVGRIVDGHKLHRSGEVAGMPAWELKLA